MPTGYTYKLHDGKPVTFREFALDCSRAFGALLHMRDEDQNAKITLREVGEYYPRRIEEIKAEIERLSAMTPKAIELEHAKIMKDMEDAATEERNKSGERRVRYQSMLDAVTAWEPPTPDHVEMKKFMVQQLTESMQFDCHIDGDSYQEKRVKSTPKNALAWHKERIKAAHADLDYARKNLAEEQDRVAAAKRWVESLMKSLPAE